jgi:hypothetical protein
MLRMALDLEAQAAQELWVLLDGLEQTCRPTLGRGDCPWGTELAKEDAEQRRYLFKLQQSANVKKLIQRLFCGASGRRRDNRGGWARSQRQPKSPSASRPRS